MKAKNWLFEAAMEAGELQTAVAGFEGVRGKTSPRTRVHLEATALLAICHLRRDDIHQAEPLIADVLQRNTNIRSERQRREFHRSIIRRFEEEGALAVLRGVGQDALDPEELESIAGHLVQTRTEDEMFAQIGTDLPETVSRRLLDIDEIARRALPESELKYLPKPRDITREGAVGRTVFGALRHVLWRSVCDPESDVYKAWFNEGMGVVLDKRYIGSAVAASFLDLGIGIKALAATVIALLVKIGVEVFCDVYRPVEVMSIKART